MEAASLLISDISIHEKAEKGKREIRLDLPAVFH